MYVLVDTVPEQSTTPLQHLDTGVFKHDTMTKLSANQPLQQRHEGFLQIKTCHSCKALTDLQVASIWVNRHVLCHHTTGTLHQLHQVEPAC